MVFELNVCSDKENWNQFVRNSPQANIFCTTQFLDTLETAYQLLFVSENKINHLGAVVLKDETGQFVKSADYFFLYQGILYEQRYADARSHSGIPEMLKATDFLLTELEKNYEKILFCLHPKFKDLRSLLWFHYHEPEKGQFRTYLSYTGIIDLSGIPDFENFLKTIRSTRRYEYRKGLKDGLIVESSNDIEKLDYLHRLTFERQGLKRDDKAGKLLRRIAAAALEQKFGELLLCKNKDGETLSATLYLYDDLCGYYLYGANHPEYRNSFSGTLLMLENIKHCQERGLREIDVCGINSPQRGDFKTSFNAEPTPYFTVIWERGK